MTSAMRVLVTGGCGYIGSFVTRHLIDGGHRVTVLDNLSAGHRWAAQEAQLVVADLGDGRAVDAALGRGFDAVVHCAAHIWVGESVRSPAKYYLNNTANAARLFDACVRHRVGSVVFSSTAAVYGEPAGLELIPESTPLTPINPYGASKLMSERVLQDLAAAHGLGWTILRYFNVAGADAKARIGEATPDNSHLVKVACETAYGLRPGMRLNGTDYPTPDGTCVRDYLHVDDLARAHVAALERLRDGGCPIIMNCGYGHGFSVREVIETVRRVSGVAFPVEEAARRPGDPPVLVADSRLLKAELGWQPRHDDLDYIVRTAWAWEQRLQAGAPAGNG